MKLEWDGFFYGVAYLFAFEVDIPPRGSKMNGCVLFWRFIAFFVPWLVILTISWIASAILGIVGQPVLHVSLFIAGERATWVGDRVGEKGLKGLQILGVPVMLRISPFSYKGVPIKWMPKTKGGERVTPDFLLLEFFSLALLLIVVIGLAILAGYALFFAWIFLGELIQATDRTAPLVVSKAGEYWWAWLPFVLFTALFAIRGEIREKWSNLRENEMWKIAKAYIKAKTDKYCPIVEIV